MKIEDGIYVWNHNCFVGRILMIQTNTFEVTKKLYRGHSQGCVLSPTNFILYTTKFHEISSEDVAIIQYADDFAILTKGKNTDDAKKKLKKAVADFGGN
jgi:hypothetical protein